MIRSPIWRRIKGKTKRDCDDEKGTSWSQMNSQPCYCFLWCARPRVLLNVVRFVIFIKLHLLPKFVNTYHLNISLSSSSFHSGRSQLSGKVKYRICVFFHSCHNTGLCTENAIWWSVNASVWSERRNCDGRFLRGSSSGEKLKGALKMLRTTTSCIHHWLLV